MLPVKTVHSVFCFTAQEDCLFIHLEVLNITGSILVLHRLLGEQLVTVGGSIYFSVFVACINQNPKKMCTLKLGEGGTKTFDCFEHFNRVIFDHVLPRNMVGFFCYVP